MTVSIETYVGASIDPGVLAALEQVFGPYQRKELPGSHYYIYGSKIALLANPATATVTAVFVYPSAGIELPGGGFLNRSREALNERLGAPLGSEDDTGPFDTWDVSGRRLRIDYADDGVMPKHATIE